MSYLFCEKKIKMSNGNDDEPVQCTQQKETRTSWILPPFGTNFVGYGDGEQRQYDNKNKSVQEELEAFKRELQAHVEPNCKKIVQLWEEQTDIQESLQKPRLHPTQHAELEEQFDANEERIADEVELLIKSLARMLGFNLQNNKEMKGLERTQSFWAGKMNNVD